MKKIDEMVRHAFTAGAPSKTVLSDSNEQKGLIIMKKKSYLSKIIGIAACAAVVAASVFGALTVHADRAVDSTVSLDVNPSIEIQVNRKERVLSVTPLNSDGKVIVGSMDFSGNSLDVTVNALIGSMVQNGYLSEIANSILISVDSRNAEKGTQLQTELTEKVNAILQSDKFSVLSQTVEKNDELKEEASSFGITPGKAQLIRDILKNNASRTFGELASMSINELNLLLNNEKPQNISITGTASDKAYIGYEKAKEIALNNAGIDASQVTKFEIELDVENGIMIYDVEFDALIYEFDCEINALTGEIVEFKKEYNDGYVPPVPENQNIISEEKAKEAALSHAKADAVTELEIKLDEGIYEIEFKSNGYEFDYEIDALTGRIIKAEKDIDD